MLGGGVAGLAAAGELQRRGVSATVLEGREHLGGRIWTDRSLGSAVDLGASWIQGTRGNPLTQLAERLKIERRATDFDSVALWEVRGASARRVADEVFAEYSVEFERLLGRLELQSWWRSRDVSVGEGLRRLLAGESLDALEERLLGWFRTTLELAAATDLDGLSATAGDDVGFGGGDVLFPGGYDQIVRHLAAGLDTRLGTHVREVHALSNEIVVVADVRGSRRELRADTALVTFSAGVLAHGDITFTPPLPTAKQRALRRLGMGVLDKLALRFPRAFWPAGREFLGCADDSPRRFPLFLDYHHYTGQPILVAFHAGTEARRLEDLSEDALVGEAMAVLRRIFGRRIAEPEAAVRSRWAADPFARGSYSHLRTGTTAELFDTLAQPAGRIHFAGEATVRDHPATVHGAYSSGLRAADRLDRFLPPAQ